MIWDQITTISYNSTIINFKNRKFEEKRTNFEVINEIFGDSFSLKWLFPLSPGGFYRFYNKLVYESVAIREEMSRCEKEELVNKKNN